MQDPVHEDKLTIKTLEQNHKHNPNLINDYDKLKIDILSDRSENRFALEQQISPNDLNTMTSGDYVNEFELKETDSRAVKNLNTNTNNNTINNNPNNINININNNTNNSPGQNVNIKINLNPNPNQIMSDRIMSDGEQDHDESSATKNLLKKPATVKHRNNREKSRVNRVQNL